MAVALVGWTWWTDPAAGGASGAAILCGIYLTAWALWDARNLRGWAAPHPLWALSWFGLYVFSLIVYPLIGALGIVAGYVASRNPLRLVRWVLRPRVRHVTWAIVLVAIACVLTALAVHAGTPYYGAILLTTMVTCSASFCGMLFGAISVWCGRGKKDPEAYAAAVTFGLTFGITAVLVPLLSTRQSPIIALHLLSSKSPLLREEVVTVLVAPVLALVSSLREPMVALWRAGDGRFVLDLIVLSVLALLGIVTALDASRQVDATREFAEGVSWMRYVGFLVGSIVVLSILMTRTKPDTSGT